MCEEQGKKMKANEATVAQWTEKLNRIEAKLDRLLDILSRDAQATASSSSSTGSS
jgi:hypothetical protein